MQEEYLETHYEMVSKIEEQLSEESGFAFDIYEKEGRGGMWLLAKELTDEFQELHKDNDWVEKNFFDELDLFWEKKLQLPN